MMARASAPGGCLSPLALHLLLLERLAQYLAPRAGDEQHRTGSARGAIEC